MTPHESPFAVAKTNWNIDLMNPASGRPTAPGHWLDPDKLTYAI